MSQQPDTYTVNEILCFDANNSDRVFIDYPDYKRLQAELSTLRWELADALDVKNGNGPTALSIVIADRDALRRENEELKSLFTVDKDGRTMADQHLDAKAENQKLRAALASARSKITAMETEADEVLDFDEFAAMLLPMDAYHGLVEIGEQIDAILSGQQAEDKGEQK